MNPPENTPRKKGEPYTIIATVKSQWKSIATRISLGLLVVSCVLAFVNYITYSKMAEYNVETISNYKIRNRPFVKIEPILIAKVKQDENSTKLHFDLKVENFGQFPAFVEKTDIWIKNILDNSKDLHIWDSNKPYTIGKFALFQNEDESFGKEFTLGKDHINKIQKAEAVYVVFSIKYNVLGIKKDLHEGPFYYWATYRCNKFIPDKGELNESFLIEECGINEIFPNT